MSESLGPARLVPPGRILERELEARGWTQRDLATVMGRPPQAINEIIRGTKQITPETAIELGNALGTSAEFWTELEAKYRLELARRQRDDPDDKISRRSRLFSLVPIGELIKRQWINPAESLDDLEREVCHFFGIRSIDQPLHLSGTLRASTQRGPEHGSIVAWVRRIEQVARQQPVGPYDRERLHRAIPDIRALAQRPEQVANVPRILQSLGVRLILVRHLPRTYIDGIAHEVDGQPVIGMSLRYDRIDSFWFTLMHELAHLVLGHECPPVDNMEDKEALSAEIEVEANEQARQWLIDQEAFHAFLKRYGTYTSKGSVEQFALNCKVHPGIVVGQIHHETMNYSKLREFLVKVSPFLGDSTDLAL